MAKEKMNAHPVYLGDSVYAHLDEMGLVLTTQNGFGPTNTIFLEHDVLCQLVEYCVAHHLIRLPARVEE